MYQPSEFREDRLDVQHELIRAHPLGLLVSHGSDGLMANAAPFLLDSAEGGLGALRGHMARANDQWAHLRDGGECLVVFQGPQAYVTPSWYQTKQETGRVVPTWNYATVHVWGRPRVIDDEAWLRGQIEDLTNVNEASRATPWEVADAPEDYVSALIRGIVGIELPIGRIEGKWKVSQNRPAADRQGVIRGLGELGPEAEAMAALVAAASADPQKPTERRRPMAMQDVTTTEDVPLSADAVWAVIGDFSGIRKWATLVEKATTTETPKGKVRTLTMPGGRTVEELLIDQEDHSYTYSLDRPDMHAYRSTVSVEPTGARTSRIVLVVRFDPKDPGQTEALKEGFGKFHRGNLKAMKRALGLA